MQIIRILVCFRTNNFNVRKYKIYVACSSTRVANELQLHELNIDLGAERVEILQIDRRRAK
jgi:hypothetical protein